MHPPAFKGRPEEGGQLEVLKLPLSFDPHVLFIVSGRSPYRLVPFSIGAGLEKVPDPLGPDSSKAILGNFWKPAPVDWKELNLAHWALGHWEDVLSTRLC